MSQNIRVSLSSKDKIKEYNEIKKCLDNPNCTVMKVAGRNGNVFGVFNSSTLNKK